MVMHSNDDSLTEEEEEQAIAPHPQPKDSPVTTTTAAQASTAEPEEAMKGLFGQLLQSMSERTEKKIADLLPQMVGKDLASPRGQSRGNRGTHTHGCVPLGRAADSGA